MSHGESWSTRPTRSASDAVSSSKSSLVAAKFIGWEGAARDGWDSWDRSDSDLIQNPKNVKLFLVVHGCTWLYLTMRFTTPDHGFSRRIQGYLNLKEFEKGNWGFTHGSSHTQFAKISQKGVDGFPAERH